MFTCKHVGEGSGLHQALFVRVLFIETIKLVLYNQ